MNIKLFSAPLINSFQNHNYNGKRNNISPLMADTISFSGKTNASVNRNYARKLIEQYQNPQFEASGQKNIPVNDLLEVCKYCGCVIKTDGGKHERKIVTPTGLRIPINGHGDAIADPGMARDIILAVKKLDENWGEIITEAGESVEKCKATAKAIYEAGSGKNSLGQINYYQEELRERLKAEEERQSLEQTIAESKATKDNAKLQNEIKELKTNINVQINILKEIKDKYDSLSTDLSMLIEIGLEKEQATDKDNNDLEKLKKSTAKKLEEEFKEKIKQKQAEIDEDIKTITPENKDDKKALEEKYSKSNEIVRNRSDEEKQFSLEMTERIADIISNSEYSQISEAVINLNSIFDLLQIIKREVNDASQADEHAKTVNITVKQAKRKILVVKQKLMEGEITTAEAQEHAEKLFNKADEIFVRYNNRKYILETIPEINNIMININKIRASVDEQKDTIEPSSYAEISQKLSEAEGYYNQNAVYCSGGTENKYLRLALDCSDEKRAEAEIDYDADRYKEMKTELEKMYKCISKLAEHLSYIPNPPKVQGEEEIAPSESKKTEDSESPYIAVSQSIFAITPDMIDTSRVANNQPQDNAEKAVESAQEEQTTVQSKQSHTDLPKQITIEQVIKDGQVEQPKEPAAEPAAKEENPVTVQAAPQEEQQSYSVSFAQKLISNIVKSIAVLPLKSVIDDLTNVVEKTISSDDIVDFQNTENSQLKQKIAGFVKGNILNQQEIKLIKRTQRLAVLKDYSDKQCNEAKELCKLQLHEATNDLLKQLATTSSYNGYSPETDKLDKIYTHYKQKLTKKDVSAVTDQVKKYIDISPDNTKDLEAVVSKQRSYIKELTNEKTLKEFRTMLLKLLLTDLDDKAGTNYQVQAENAIDRYEEKQKLEQKMQALDDMDLSDISDSIF